MECSVDCCRSHGVVALFWSIKYNSETNETDIFFRLISVLVYVYALRERNRRRVPLVTGDKWAQEAGDGEKERVREPNVYIPIAEFLREQFAFIGLSEGVAGTRRVLKF